MEKQKTDKIQKQTVDALMSKYKKIGVVAAIIIALGVGGVYLGDMFGSKKIANVEAAVEKVSTDAANAADLNIAVIRMDAIQTDAKVLESLRKQREKYETNLQKELNEDRDDLEEEKKDIEKAQGMLSQDALQRRVIDYQNRIGKLQQDLTEKAQSINAAYQTSLNEVQSKHLDPIIESIIEKKKLSMVLDGRFVRLGEGVQNLDITNDVINALNKRISNVKMEKPKGL